MRGLPDSTEVRRRRGPGPPAGRRVSGPPPSPAGAAAVGHCWPHRRRWPGGRAPPLGPWHRAGTWAHWASGSLAAVGAPAAAGSCYSHLLLLRDVAGHLPGPPGRGALPHGGARARPWVRAVYSGPLRCAHPAPRRDNVPAECHVRRTPRWRPLGPLRDLPHHDRPPAPRPRPVRGLPCPVLRRVFGPLLSSPSSLRWRILPPSRATAAITDDRWMLGHSHLMRPLPDVLPELCGWPLLLNYVPHSVAGRAFHHISLCGARCLHVHVCVCGRHFVHHAGPSGNWILLTTAWRRLGCCCHERDISCRRKRNACVCLAVLMFDRWASGSVFACLRLRCFTLSAATAMPAGPLDAIG